MIAPDEPFPVHEFTLNVEGLTVYVQVLLMDASLLLWAQGSSPSNGNGAEAHFDSLALAMPTRFVRYFISLKNQVIS